MQDGIFTRCKEGKNILRKGNDNDSTDFYAMVFNKFYHDSILLDISKMKGEIWKI